MDTATSTTQVIGTATGQRAIQFVFTLTDGARKTAVIDFVRQPEFNGRTYAALEAVALAGMVAHGYTADKVKTFTHRLIG